MTLEQLRRGLVWMVYAIVVVTPFFYFKQGVYPYVLSKALFFQGLVEILFFGYLALAIIDKRYRPMWKSPLMIALGAFFAVLVLVSLFGEDISRSFWSSQERSGGVVLFMHLIAFVVVVIGLFKDIRWERLLKLSLGTSVGVSLIAFLQTQVSNLLLVENVSGRPGATFGNPTFFAGYLDFNIFIALYFLLQGLRDKNRDMTASIVFPAIALVVNSAALLLTQTRGDIVGMGIAAIVFIALLVVRPLDFGPALARKRSVYAGLLAGLVVVGGLFWFTRSAGFWQNIPGLNRFADVSLASEGLQPRFIAYRAAWQGFLERPILGWGWENFNIVYNKHYDPQALEYNYQETRFDKPHNLYLEYMVTGGVVLMLAFIALIVTLVRAILRLKNVLLGTVLTTALVAYLVRSAFVFDTLGSLLMLYLVIALVEGLTRQEAVQTDPVSKEKLNLVPNPTLQWGLVGAGVVIAYLLNFLSLQATYHQYYGYKYFLANRPTEAIASFKKAIAIPSPYRWNLKRDYATVISEAYFYNPGLVPKAEAAAAIIAMGEVAAAHPKDAYNHYAFVDMYNQVSDVDPENYLAGAEREAAIALELSPNRQEVYFSLAKTKSLQNDYEGAIKLLEHTLSLNNNIPDAHFYYGLIAFASNKFDVGYREIKIAMELGRPWKNFNEPRVVANYFADYERLSEAAELYQVSLAMHEDPEARLKLGTAYFFMGDRALAKEHIEKALKMTDITKAVSYQDFLPILQELGLAP